MAHQGALVVHAAAFGCRGVAGEGAGMLTVAVPSLSMPPPSEPQVLLEKMTGVTVRLPAELL